METIKFVLVRIWPVLFRSILEWTEIDYYYLQKWRANIIEEYTACQSFDAGYNRCIMFWEKKMYLF